MKTGWGSGLVKGGRGIGFVGDEGSGFGLRRVIGVGLRVTFDLEEVPGRDLLTLQDGEMMLFEFKTRDRDTQRRNTSIMMRMFWNGKRRQRGSSSHELHLSSQLV